MSLLLWIDTLHLNIAFASQPLVCHILCSHWWDENTVHTLCWFYVHLLIKCDGGGGITNMETDPSNLSFWKVPGQQFLLIKMSCNIIVKPRGYKIPIKSFHTLYCTVTVMHYNPDYIIMPFYVTHISQCKGNLHCIYYDISFNILSVRVCYSKM